MAHLRSLLLLLQVELPLATICPPNPIQGCQYYLKFKLNTYSFYYRKKEKHSIIL